MSEFRELRRTYGFDEVAIAPGTVTINPAMTDTKFSVGDISIDIPIIGSAMDAVASPKFASEMHSQGALSVMNLEGVQTRYESAQDAIDEVINTDNDKVTSVMQKIYSRPIKEELISKRIAEIKKHGAVCAVSITPAMTKKLGPIAVEAGADVLVVQSTVNTARHSSNSVKGLQFPELLEMGNVPIFV